LPKKKGSISNADEWGMNFNRQGSKKGISTGGALINLGGGNSQFMSNKLAF
jgi:hypothetical protein